MLTKNGKLITGNEDGGLRFTATDKSTDPNTGKPFSATLRLRMGVPRGTLYRITFQRMPNYGFSTAVGLFKGLTNCILLLSVNAVCKKINGTTIM